MMRISGALPTKSSISPSANSVGETIAAIVGMESVVCKIISPAPCCAASGQHVWIV